MNAPHPLDRLVEEETFREIVAHLEPEELVIAALRLEGLPDAQIGALLDLSQAGVSKCMERARARIAAADPDLAFALRRRQWGLDPCRGGDVLPLERGWLCRWDAPDRDEEDPGEPDLTTEEVAQRCRVSVQTVRYWIRTGRFPHAYRVGQGAGTYRIPAMDLPG
jgi:excisionase family DNA binding protein